MKNALKDMIFWPKDEESQIKCFRREFLTLAICSTLLFPPVSFLLFQRMGYFLNHFLMIILAFVFSVGMFLWNPMSPFRKTLFEPLPLDALSINARKVLFYLKSSKAKKLAIVASSVCSIAYLILSILNHKQFAGHINSDSAIGILGFSFLNAMWLYSIEVAFVHVRLPKSFSSDSPMWPLDRKFPTAPFTAEPPKKKTKLDKIYDILYIIFAFLVLLLYLKYRGKI